MNQALKKFLKMYGIMVGIALVIGIIFLAVIAWVENRPRKQVAVKKNVEKVVVAEQSDIPPNSIAVEEKKSLPKRVREGETEEAKKAFESAVELSAADFEYELTDNAKGVRLTKYIGTEKAVKVPSEVEGLPVTELGRGVFNTSGVVDVLDGLDIVRTIVETIVIPDSVTTLCGVVMESFVTTPLKYIKLSESISNIPERAFAGCGKLESIYIPDSVTSIDRAAFRGTGLKYIDLPDGVSLDEQVFASCDLEKVTLPQDIKKIPKGLFSGCTALQTIDIPESVTSIEDEAFYKSGIKKINLSKRLRLIGEAAFNSCESLEELVIPESVEVIKKDAFAGSYSMKKLVFPDSLTSTRSNEGTSLLFRVTGIEELRLPNPMSFMPDVSELEHLKTVNLPANLKECNVRFPESLEKVIIPDSLKSVTFSDKTFENVKLPLLTQKRLRELGYTGAFAGSRSAD